MDNTFYSDNIFFFRYLNAVGGIETFYYYLAKLYKDYDITIFYFDADSKQYRRLSKLVRVRKYIPPLEIYCKKAFFNFNLDIIDSVHADEYYQIAHGDYKAMQLIPPSSDKIQKYIGVTKHVCDTFEEVTGHKTELCYNPIALDDYVKPIRLISATRLTHEKGRDKMVSLINKLNEHNIPFEWHVFTDNTNEIKDSSVVYRKPNLNIINQMLSFDYLVQLSDNEGYCYSVVEANAIGIPVIITDLPVFRELKIQGYLYDDVLENPDIIYNIPKVEYTPPHDRWDEILYPSQSTYYKDYEEMVTVQAIQTYYDIEMKRIVGKGEKFKCNRVRAEQHLNTRVAVII